MHVAVIIPFHHQGNLHTLRWTLEGLAQQTGVAPHSFEVLVGVDGGEGAPLALPQVAGVACRFFLWPALGAAAVRNALVQQTPGHTELLIFLNADTRPEPDLVQRHIETITALPAGSLVLGSAPLERGPGATVLEALIDETATFYSFPVLLPGTWHTWHSANMLNVALRRDQFLAAGGFPEALRPLYFEDLVLAHRLIGAEPRVYYHPQARAVHRHLMSVEEYLDREEAVGVMTPVLARVAPQSFGEIFGAQATVETLARRYDAWVRMDLSAHRAAFQCLKVWAQRPQICLGTGAERAQMLQLLGQMHLPLKRLAARLGFLQGMPLASDSQWQRRQPQGLWRQALGTR